LETDQTYQFFWEKKLILRSVTFSLLLENPFSDGILVPCAAK